MASVNRLVDTYPVVDTYAFARSAADTPLAKWLVEQATAHRWRSARQAAAHLGVNDAALSTWVRGEVEPDRLSQERLARATGTPLEEVAELVRRTKSEKQRLTVGDLRRMGAEQEEAPGPTTWDELGTIGARLDRIEKRMLTEEQIRAIFEDYLRRRDAGDLPHYLDDPPEPDASDDDVLREAVG